MAAYWVFFVLGLSYNNYNLLFTMKYWTLSQKLESLILHEKQISERRLRIISGIFWMIQVVMIVSGVLLLIFAYKIEDYIKINLKLQIAGFSGIFIAAFASLVFAVDSFRRLNKCLEHHDRLGITRK